jgi:3-methylcrotonyl-CoA carboxylase beta subunit
MLRTASVLNTSRATQRAYHASVLPSIASTTSPEFLAKAEAMDALVVDLEAKTAEARLGGGAKATERMKGKGKKLPRERCASVTCPHSSSYLIYFYQTRSSA